MTEKTDRKHHAVDAPRISIYSIDPDESVIIGLDTNDGPEHELWGPEVRDPLDLNMVANIMELGVLVPVIVRKDPKHERPVVVDGRTRIRAAREANARLKKQGLETLRVKASYESSREKKRLAGIMVSANEIRRVDGLLRKAGKAKHLVQVCGHSEEEAGVRMGVSVSTIKNWVTIADMPSEVHDAIRQGRTNVTRALEHRDDSPEALIAWAKAEVALVAPQPEQQDEGPRRGQPPQLAAGRKRKRPGKVFLKKILKDYPISSELYHFIRWVVGDITAETVAKHVKGMDAAADRERKGDKRAARKARG